MTQTVVPLRVNVPLHPLLIFFNVILNLMPSILFFGILVFYCKFSIKYRAVYWIFLRCVDGFIHFIILFLFTKYFFIWKKSKHGQTSWTTILSVLYISTLAFELSWDILGSVFFSKYVPEVKLAGFHLVSLMYIIIGWIEIVFVPTLFLICRIIIQMRRNQRIRKYLREQPRPVDDVQSVVEPFKTGGCCACCVENDDSRCCCCRCSCCEPQGVLASYILGEDLGEEYTMQSREEEMEEMEEREEREEREEIESSCCVCCDGKEIIEGTTDITNTIDQPQTLQPERPILVLPQNVVIPESINGNIPVLEGMKVVEALATDGSGRTVFLALPNIH